MTLTPFMIYLAGIADPIGKLLFFLVVASVFVTVVSAMGAAIGATDEFPVKVSWKVPVRTAVLGVVIAVLMALTPSTKTIAAMYVLPAVVNSEAVQKLPAEATGLALDWIRELRREMKK